MPRLRTVTVTLLGAFGLLVALSAPAFAHVTVTAPGATSGGGDQEITFRVPVEEAAADTVGVTIQLPTATPIASVDVLPIAGWTHTQQTTKLATPIKTDDGDITEAVSQITWTATAGGLKPGEYGEFTIIAGQLPETKSLTFKAIQTYSDGSVVRWIQTPAPGSTAEPEDPAPVLQLASGSSASSGSSTAPTVTATPQATSGQSDADNTGPVVLSIIALVVAAAALGLAVVSRAKDRKHAMDSST